LTIKYQIKICYNRVVQGNMAYIKVKVHPESKKEKIEKISDDKFEVWVTEKAERNQVNKKLCDMISHYFNNPDGGVKILNGHHHRIKLLKVGNN
jgi:uncharacterized protein YggU (UPF0235/DUF167 family)